MLDVVLDIGDRFMIEITKFLFLKSLLYCVFEIGIIIF